MAWKHYSELIVWQKSMDLVEEIYQLIKKLPRTEEYALSSQIRRAAISIPSNIAEGSGRKTEKEFYYFLSVARGSLMELETQLYICIRQKYFTENDAAKAFSLCEETGRILTKLLFNNDNIIDSNN